VTNHTKLAAVAMLGLIGVAGCNDFLKGGELTTDPNRPVVATLNQRFQGIESNVWAILGSDPPRTMGILAQQFFGAQSQYQALQTAYSVDPNTTNGLHSGLYASGGLVDIAALKSAAAEKGDSIYLGIAQIQEAILMGTAADLFGDLVYKEALAGTPNPVLDDQFTVYDSVQTVLSAAIVNLSTTPSGINAGPGGADLVYGGDPELWKALAYTLKARFYMHTAEVKPEAYAQALLQVPNGISSDDGNFVGAFTSTTNEQNFYYQFNFTAGRAGYLTPNPTFVSLMEERNDPRLERYFELDATGAVTDLSATRLAPDFRQPYVTHDENTLIWAEAAYRTGDFATALAKLNEERENNGLPSENVSGLTLLNEILLEQYIADFQVGIEPFNLYKRTCTPNLVPTVSGQKIPRRLFYDTNEQQTDTNIPQAGQGVNGFANRNDPPNATSDGTGEVCLGQ
jgi:starch-binding outer membrane protein, SusD/RagB family